ncbi:diguanylate cyclase domain-containing protein [Gracilinema caldarium]|uniref:diguanylate cyclase n=1 Tax=Gracilinema caldarium (strain ATCC 51460 / DSM 7334 / H1) TaxID=744872 RepID=F8F4H9_GRAC1|nr:diguanylate cyclase [Gracilinema caldarium]AEJ20626.1 diguanylate cyclase [Gracilinema caldarium DSM 7334]
MGDCNNQDILKKSSLFSGLLTDDEDYIVSRVSRFQLRKGARLFTIGDPADRFYYIVSGSIRVFRIKTDGQVEELAIFTGQDLLGEFDFARQTIYDAVAVALEDTELICFPALGLNFEDIKREKPDTVSRILLRSLSMISSRLRSTQKLISENTSWVQELRRRAYEDPGTGLWNRAFLDEEIRRELQAPTALILMKPDRFKILVDGLGHSAGDEAMVSIAGILKSLVRQFGRGWALRFKSNEVGLCLPRCSLESAQTVAQNLYKAVTALTPISPTEKFPGFTFSATVVFGVWPDMLEDWDTLVQQQYVYMVEQWQAGGNRVISFPGHLTAKVLHNE